MLEYLRQRLAALLAERAELAAKRDAVLTGPTTEQRDLTADESKAFEEARTAIIAHDETINECRARISNLEDDEKRQLAVDSLAATLGRSDGNGGIATRTQPRTETYARGGPHSYFRDLVQAQVLGERSSIERLVTSDREQIAARSLTTVAGGVGEFVPPLWLINEYIALARAGRVIADQVRNQPLPSGTNVINLPKILTGTAVAEQTTQNTAVQNTDATSTSIAANVATIAGQQVISLQLLEQTPIGLNIDEILLADLAADYATKLDVFVINNNAAGKLGILNVASLNAVTFTSASPTVPLVYSKVADAIQRIATLRFMPAQKIFMHPRRWAWFLASLDTSNRPLVVPTTNLGPNNAMIAGANVGAIGGAGSEQGPVGTLQGLPVWQDPSIPINLGAGTNEDRIIVARTDDIILFEGNPRAEAFREPLAANLSILLRFYNYAALHASRYPGSISVIAGTGLVTPTF